MALAGCASDPVASPDAGPCVGPRALVPATDWTLVAANEDPFRREMPLDAGTATVGPTRGRCDVDDARAEDLAGAPSFSIVTLGCAWGTAETRTTRAVPEGTPLEVRIWHFSQVKVMAAEARVLIALDERPLWETRVPLPAEGALIAERFTTPVALPLGARIRWHVSNHGQNSWNFLSLTEDAAGPCEP